MIVAIKLLYLVLGLMLKQTMDEIRAASNRYADGLDARAEAVGTYPRNSPVAARSAEAVRTIAKERHRMATSGEVHRLKRLAKRVRDIPVLVYGTATIALFVAIVWLEIAASVDRSPIQATTEQKAPVAAAHEKPR